MPKDKLKKPRGRPTEPIPADKAEEVIQWVSEGNTLRDFCRQKGNPTWRTVYFWMEKDADFAARFAHARELGHDAISEECVAILDEKPQQYIDMTGNSRVDPGFVQWQKNRVEQRLKLLAKWNPKKYGDAQQSGDNGKGELAEAIKNLADKLPS